MKRYTEICEVPTDREVVDSSGFTWSYRHGAWGFTYPARDDTRWHASYTADAGRSTAWMGPFAEVS